MVFIIAYALCVKYEEGADSSNGRNSLSEALGGNDPKENSIEKYYPSKCAASPPSSAIPLSVSSVRPPSTKEERNDPSARAIARNYGQTSSRERLQKLRQAQTRASFVAHT